MPGILRPKIAFFDYSDAFEDFYPQYGVDQTAFATRWDHSGNHAFLRLIQAEIGDVTWYSLSLQPQVPDTRHSTTGCLVRFRSTSCLHRALWSLFYASRFSWRWRNAYPAYAAVAAYLAPLSFPVLHTLVCDRPDFLFVQDYSSGKFDVLSALSVLLRVPLVAYHSGSEMHTYDRNILRRLTLSRAHRLIASGSREADLLVTTFNIPRERIAVVLTPINTDLYAPAPRTAAARDAGLDPSRRYLLFVGRLDDGVKRVSAIIAAFGRICASYPDVDFVIVGDGNDRERLERSASTLAGRVHFLGWVTSETAKARLYAASECLVLASSREGFPTVIAEAMACGTPVISSDVGAVQELVRDGKTGWLVPPGDDEALTAAIKHVVGHPSIVAGMRPRARALAEARVSPAAVGAGLRSCFS